MKDQVIKLFHEFKGKVPEEVTLIPHSVSARRYFRLCDGKDILIGTWSPDVRETEAFVTYAGHFRKAGVNVPEIFTVSSDMKCYLQEDLGNSRMHEIIMDRSSTELSEKQFNLYKKAFEQLAKLQVEGHEGLDYSIAVPRSDFDRQSVMWDLNHFKYYFLKLSGIPFDEQKLEIGFIQLAEYIDALPRESFMFRDFQTRNVMVKDDEVYLIDFQGGRRGALQYDPASMIYESRTALEKSDRSRLLEIYLDCLEEYREVNREEFKAELNIVAIVRVLQALGAYGLRGKVEKKAIFLQSIPEGLKNLGELISNSDLENIDPYLNAILKELAGTMGHYPGQPEEFNGLTVAITSFSYRKPLPDDLSGNGGGFVFDCRFMKNPYHDEDLREYNGLDQEIIQFLESEQEVKNYLTDLKSMISRSINVYKQKSYKNLMVSFGCTGGRHRSVYTAHTIAEWLREQQGIRVVEVHRELDKRF